MSFPINFWYGIRPDFISRERLCEAKEAGFNIIECRYDTKTNKMVLKWCHELGLKAYLWDDRIKDAILKRIDARHWWIMDRLDIFVLQCDATKNLI